MIVSIMETIFQKLKARIVHYVRYTEFSNVDYRKNLLQNLSLENINTKNKLLKKILQICINTLDQIAPRKKKDVRDNNMLI